MMLYPPMGELMDKVGSRYLLVNMVAQRARELSDELNDGYVAEGYDIDDKAVSIAINEIYSGKLTIK